MASNLVKPCVDNPSFLGHYIPNPSPERGTNLHLGVHPKNKNVIIYPSGKFVVVRNLDAPSDGFMYRGHNSLVTVAKFSPSGNWVASGDSSGKVRVWAWDTAEHNLKSEIMAIGGAVKDLVWDSENKRIVAVGDGSLNMRVFTWDTGNNLGTMVGHTKTVISCDYRQCRPFKIITASEDMRTMFFKGPPFAMDHSNKDQHTNFINVVRYSPDGSLIASAGSDSKIWLYDGNSGDPIESFPVEHKGSIYALTWSDDSQRIVTASADKTCRLWNISTKQCEHIWTFSDSPEIGDMQCACGSIANGAFVSVNLKGDISVLQIEEERPVRTISAHMVSVTAMCPTTIDGDCIVTGSFDGVIMLWRRDGCATRFAGQLGSKTYIGASHSNKVNGIAVSAAGILSIGWDDTLRIASSADHEYVDSVQISSQPVGLSASKSSELVALCTIKSVALYKKLVLCSKLEVKYTPKCIAICGEREVAVGSDSGDIYVYTISNEALEELIKVSGHRGAVVSVSYSPNEMYLAAGDSAGEVTVWQRDGTNYVEKVRGLWQFHTSTVNAVAWCSDSRILASGGQDESVYIWNIDAPRKRICYKFANKDGVIGLCWLDANTLASTGGDQAVALWDVGKEKESAFS